MTTGPGGELQEAFERGLRFLAAGLALHQDHRSGAATVTAACDAIRCFMVILEAAAQRSLPDPGGEVRRLRAQLEALLTPEQGAEEAMMNAVEAARLARDTAAALLPALATRKP
ncbi:MAG TPA: hypothetical protein VJ623_02960 [Holophagaceae bacterium]|nr:hypothetical protein [Holophagaceae bacterium]